MFWCRKTSNETQCLKTLKQALLGKKPVKVETLSGLLFIDEVVGLEVFAGTEVAVLKNRGAVKISEIEQIVGA